MIQSSAFSLRLLFCIFCLVAIPLTESEARIAAVSAVSRMTHGAAGDFDIPLPLTGPAGVECRYGTHQIIVTFATPVTVAGASVSTGTGSVSDFAADGSQVTVNLSGVANAQRIAITLSGVNNGTVSGDVVVAMNVLLGDVNGNGSVNSSDVSQIQFESGHVLGASNFRADVTANGGINSSDVSTARHNPVRRCFVRFR